MQTTQVPTSQGYPVTVLHLLDYQKNDLAIYFSIVLGIFLGYILIKGLLSNWKS